MGSFADSLGMTASPKDMSGLGLEELKALLGQALEETPG